MTQGTLPPDLLREPEALLTRLTQELTPAGLGGGGARAHQFTINGLTYPFVRHYNFAAVPDPPKNRRYDMYAGLHAVRPGDFIFFFQADPQDPIGLIDSRRGLRGIYQTVKGPYRGLTNVVDGVTGCGYEILGTCPACGTFHGAFSRSCPICDVEYPTVKVRRDDHQKRVLSCRLPIRPYVLFERSVSDERVYADLADPGLVWIGRHDNAMGPGKGSSIRHLLPEEAVKLARLLLAEPGQRVGDPSALSDGGGAPLRHADGQPVDCLPIGPAGEVAAEDELYFALVRQLHHEQSPFSKIIQDQLPPGLNWAHLEYVSPTFPWGYTAGTADLVLFFRAGEGRRAIVIVECKRGSAHDEAVLQVMLYAERVLQVAFASAPSSFYPREPVHIIPVVVARALRRVRHVDPRLALPRPYLLERAYLGREHIRAQVESPVFLTYRAPDHPEPECGLGHAHVDHLTFARVPAASTVAVDWQPYLGAVGTTVEANHIIGGPWAAARAAAGA